jgi:hypothetical protein
MHHNAFRFTRYAMVAWTTFALTFLLSKSGAAYFGLSASLCDTLTTVAGVAFAAGCLFSSGIGGLLTFARTTRF